MARLTGLEPVTKSLENSCSIQLSYRRKLLGGNPLVGGRQPNSC